MKIKAKVMNQREKGEKYLEMITKESDETRKRSTEMKYQREKEGENKVRYKQSFFYEEGGERFIAKKGYKSEKIYQGF